MAVSFPSARIFYLGALVAAVGTLAAVLIMEFGFGLKPCELCTFQRAPYVIAILVSLAGLFTATPARHHIFLSILSLLFLTGAGLGAYHVAVEKKLIAGPTACTSTPSAGPMTMEDLKNQIMAAPKVACDEPQWEWHGVTLAGLNLLWSGLLFVCYSYGFLRYRRRHAS